ncbi:MAG: cysteine desulfurase-like protein, partial [Chloroflexi bacterium]|nr:cysteine desulfurase-like protein [Chloroflexota bacterium]
FPALQETDAQGQPYAYFDGPGGTQAPQSVLIAITDYLTRANANKGGQFITSRRSDEIIHQARLAMADFLNASSPQEIVFGTNMTTLTYNLSRSIGRALQPGDEIVVTRLDHDANISPWLALEEQGAKVKWADFDVEDCRLGLEHLASLITARTKLVAVGYASNAVGTINPVGRIAALARNVGAWLWVDAVHYAPHGPIDVQALGCDFLVCSAYKFFGPHLGVLWGRLELLERLRPYQVRPANPNPPYTFEREFGGAFTAETSGYTGRRQHLKQAMQAIIAYERPLLAYLLTELQTIPGLTIYGITNPEHLSERCPTVAFTMAGFTPRQIAAYLDERGIFVWDVNYLALSVTERLGVEGSGGMVRVGLVHYNTRAEIERLLTALREL